MYAMDEEPVVACQRFEASPSSDVVWTFGHVDVNSNSEVSSEASSRFEEFI
jgi:hypothetical protein